MIARRRESLSQAAAADEYGVTLYRYRLWELDKCDPPVAAIGSLADHERCFLLRRRKGWSLGEVADDLGCSSWWLTQMERGKVAASVLVDYWADAA